VISYTAVYLFGVATSSAVVLVDVDARAGLTAAAAALPVSRLRTQGPTPAPSPDVQGPSAVAPTPVRIPLSVIQLAGEPMATEPGALAAGAPLEASGRVMVLEDTRSAPGELRSVARRERSVGFGPARSPGPPLDDRQVRGVVSSHMPAIRRCYERVSRRAGFGSEERLELELQIARGVVRSAVVTGASSGQLGQCIQSSAQRWRFPEGSARVAVPLRLRPDER